MEEKLVSVVIPIYNAEKFLEKCVNSVLNQSYKNIEVILVDDGSKDSSLEICNSFQNLDHRIKVISKQNSGVGDTRNKGIEESNGYYLMFVDSDDFLPLNAIHELVCAIYKRRVDLICGKWSEITVRGINVNNYEDKDVYVDEQNEILKYLDIPEVNGPVAKLFVSSIIKKNNIFFPIDMKIGEDAVFCYTYISNCKKVGLLNSVVYYYNRLNGDSVTHSYYDKFNHCCLQCAIAQVNVINKSGENDYLNQIIFYNRLKTAIRYILFYDLGKNKTFCEITKTFDLFEQHLSLGDLQDELFKDELFNNLIKNRCIEEFYVSYKKNNTNLLSVFLKNKTIKFLKNKVIEFLILIKTKKIYGIHKNDFKY